jgi:outer membrane protein assembly factor BamE (lipoprotein component of BamABCDE complex)
MKALHKTGHVLVASALLLAIAGAHAAGTVNPPQEAMVQTGMSMQEVQQALGKPSEQEKFGIESGRTWTYNVVGAGEIPKVFDVDFSRDGRVVSASERLVPHPFGTH